MIPCNLDNKFSIEEDRADDTVIFQMTDYSSPVSGDITEKKEFQVLTRRMSESNFVRFFKSNYENDGAYDKVNTAERIYSIHKDLKIEDVKERWQDSIESATSGKGKVVKDQYIEKLFKEKKKLRLNGGLQIVTHFIHVPGVK